MANYELEHFITDCEAVLAADAHAADRVTAIAPLMERLLDGDMSFLKSQPLSSDPQHYARNAIYVAPDEQLSLFVLVWLPGQWTPVHEHGSWGGWVFCRVRLRSAATCPPTATLQRAMALR